MVEHLSNQRLLISFCAGEPPVDPSVGFLPPNNDTDGQGYVTFTVRPKQQVSSLSRIDARATIIFDQNEPIDTPPIFNTVHIHPHTKEKYKHTYLTYEWGHIAVPSKFYYQSGICAAFTLLHFI